MKKLGRAFCKRRATAAAAAAATGTGIAYYGNETYGIGFGSV